MADLSVCHCFEI